MKLIIIYLCLYPPQTPANLVQFVTSFSSCITTVVDFSLTTSKITTPAIIANENANISRIHRRRRLYCVAYFLMWPEHRNFTFPKGKLYPQILKSIGVLQNRETLEQHYTFFVGNATINEAAPILTPEVQLSPSRDQT